MTTRERAQEAAKALWSRGWGYRAEKSADAASDVWEPKVNRLKALLRMFHTESVCRYPNVPCDVCEALQDE